MSNIVRRIADKILSVLGILAHQNAPVWLTLLLTLGGTYLIAPVINRDIQRENLRREFLVDSLNSLSGDTIKLITKVNAFVASGLDPSSATEISNDIIEIQFRLVQLNIALPVDAPAGTGLQQTLNELLDAVMKGSRDNGPDVKKDLSAFSSASFLLYQEVVKDAGLT